MISESSRNASPVVEWTIDDTFEDLKSVASEAYGWMAGFVRWLKVFARTVWAKTSRRMRIAGGLTLFFAAASLLCRLDRHSYKIPEVSLDYTQGALGSPFNASKVALLIENRPLPILAPLILHFISVVPPDWRFRFMGSNYSVSHLNESFAIRNQVEIGKLDLTYIPANMSTEGSEQISRFLTNRWLYETVLQPAEWLLVFQTDSILCANSQQSLNNWLDYDWVGAPWNTNGRFGGNGGLSLRRVSAIVEILKNQVRRHNSEPEDVWLSERLGHRPGARLANGTASLTFSGEMHAGLQVKVTETKKGKGGNISNSAPAKRSKDSPTAFVKGIDDWREGFYEPMGYHTGGSGSTLHGGIWGSPKLRKHIWDYCPEVKMTLVMDAAKYVPGDCKSNWKRDATSSDEHEYSDRADVDENGYPYLPELVPW